jgi:hypothetical protein
VGSNPIRFRRSSAITVAAVITLLAGVSLFRWAPPYAAVLLLIPLGVAVWSWRSGTDADGAGLTVRAAVGRRRIPWSEVAGVITEDGQVSAQLTSGRAITLPAVGPADVGRLIAASGHGIGADSSGSVTDPT